MTVRATAGLAGGLAFLAIGTAALSGGVFAEEASTDTPAFWGTPTVDGGKCCRTLGEVRTNIDRIDHALVALMAERGRYVHEAARFKRDPAAVEDVKRVEVVMQKARRIASEAGLNPDVAETTYRAMVAAFTADEQRISAEATKK